MKPIDIFLLTAFFMAVFVSAVAGVMSGAGMAILPLIVSSVVLGILGTVAVRMS